MNKDYLSKRFRHYRDLARLPVQIHFHSLRHTYASKLVQQGASVYKVQALLGHSDVRTTQLYAHLTGASLRADVERVYGRGNEVDCGLDLVAEVDRLRNQVKRLQDENARLHSRLVGDAVIA